MTRLSRFFRRLARSSLWRVGGPAIALVLLVQHSCLVPQSIQNEFAAHVPPVIVDRLLVPDGRKGAVPLYLQGASDPANCHCQVLLSATIEEDDPNLDLTAKWFIDYDVNDSNSTNIVSQQDLFPPSDGVTTTRTLEPLTFPQGSTTGGLHYVDVVVAETAAYTNDADAGPHNRGISPGYTAAEFRWIINVDSQQDPSRPTCRSDPTYNIQRADGCPQQ